MTACYSVLVKSGAEREIRNLPAADRKRVLRRIGRLASDPRPPDCKKLQGTDAYRIRQGDYRILYAVDDPKRVVIVYRVGQRSEVYR